MATRWDELTNRATGQRLIMRRSPAETGGALLELEAIFAPGGAPPPAHLHPRQEERFTALAGTLRVRLAGRERHLGAGETLVIPPGMTHAMWNDTGEEARVRWETRPALRTADFFAAFFALASDGGSAPLTLALLLHAFRDEYRLSGPLAPVQPLLVGPLAAVARLRGRRLPGDGARPARRGGTCDG
jgi:quercetin dioxygenase-like cupin family protein